MDMRKIEELDLSVRAYNCLKRAKIETVEQLQQMTDDDLLRIRNMGVGTVAEIREKVFYVNTMTNEDRIRAMSRQDLALFLCNLMNADDCYTRCPAKDYCYHGHNGMAEYLSSPAKEDEDDGN